MKYYATTGSGVHVRELASDNEALKWVGRLFGLREDVERVTRKDPVTGGDVFVYLPDRSIKAVNSNLASATA